MMRGRRKLLVLVSLLPLLGCLYIGEEGPGGGPPGPMGTVRIGVGGSGGLWVAPDEWLTPGIGGELEATVWLSKMLGIRGSLGYYIMADMWEGGELTVMPGVVTAMFSMPVAANQAIRTTFGAGYGTLRLSHSAATVDNDLATLVIVGGSEWVLADGGRLFALTDLYFSPMVGIGSYLRDLTMNVTLRVGVEFTF